jgi:rhomboid protease GluP
MTEPETGPGGGPPEPPPALSHPAPAAARPPTALQASIALAAFRRALGELTPRGFVTEALIAVNVLVFVLMVVRGVSPMEPKVADLLVWGADYGPRTTSGEWWRMFTATFVHIGLLHIAMNMYVLWVSGRMVERIFGNLGFLVLYVASGLAGSVASLLWSPYVVSAGASGAIFGVYGGLAGFLVRERRSIPREALATLQRSAVFFVGYNLLFGLGLNKSGALNVDMAAHLGGLAGGFVCGLALAYPLTREGASTRWMRAAAVAAGTAALIVLATRAVPRAAFDYFTEIDGFAAMEKRALAAFNEALEQNKANKITDAELAEAIDTRVLPEWRASRERFAGAKGLPAPQARLVGQVAAYMTAREEGFGLVAEAGRTGNAALIEKANEKQAKAAALVKEIGK